MTATLSHVHWQVQSEVELKLHYLNSFYEGEKWDMKCKYYRLVSAHGGSRVSWSRTQRQSMNVGWADFHLVIYKLSGYVLNSHWSDGALFRWKWPVAMLFQSHEPTSCRFIELRCVWLAEMFLRAGPSWLFINLIRQCCRDRRIVRNDLSKHIQCPVSPLDGQQDVPPLLPYLPLIFGGTLPGSITAVTTALKSLKTL